MPGAELLLIVAVHLLLTALPAAAAALFAARMGISTLPLLLAIALVATGLAAILAFWAYFADPLVGQTLSYLLLFGSVAACGSLLYEREIPGQVLRGLATAAGLWALGSFFLVFLGFLHGHTDTPIATGASRFLGPLPSDSAIPAFFADWFYEHGHEKPVPIFPGEWLSSDRPPLQVGFVLAQRPLQGGDKELHYQVLGVVLQQLWIVGLWALVLAARIDRLGRALVITAALLSSLVLVNGFFVWPKLLPAAMLLGVAALVLTPLWDELRQKLWAAVLIAALCGLAMLGHGSSVFGIVPLAAVAAVRGVPSWRWIGAGVAVGIVLMGSWSAYQRIHDPPGDRLVKWMLGGVTEIDDRGVGEAIVDTYRAEGVGGTLENKLENFHTMVGGDPAAELLDNSITALGDGDLGTADRELRGIFFFYLFPSLGLLLLAPIPMLIWRRRASERPEDWSFALACFAVVAIGCAAWGLLLIGSLPARAVIHIGSYLLPLLAIAGCVVGLRAVLPRFAVYWVAISVATMLGLYVPAFAPQPGTSYSAFAAFVAALSLGGFWLLAYRSGPQPAKEVHRPMPFSRRSP